MSGKLIAFRGRDKRLPPEEAEALAKDILRVPVSERIERVGKPRLEDPELLLSICDVLRRRYNTSPASVHTDAEFFHQFLEQPARKIGLYDEREYFLGELSLIAGTSLRFLFRREEARRWFDRAESKFALTENASAHFARLAYQRLALRLEERQFDDVLELAPQWREVLVRLELKEDALKCRFLEAAALQETDRSGEAIEVLNLTCREAEAQGNVKLLAQAVSNLAQYYRTLGDLKEALLQGQRALPLLQQLDDRVSLSKLRWSVGDIFREQGKVGEAVDAYRAALREAEEIGIRGDVAAIHLVLADVLLDAGFDRQAEWEIRAALPIIEEEKMVPEGYAALTLLQESLRRRKIDRQALRNLHGFFQDEKA